MPRATGYHLSVTVDGEAAMSNWYEGPLASFDTETTGVDVEHDRIVTAALVVQESAGGPVRRRDARCPRRSRTTGSTGM